MSVPARRLLTRWARWLQENIARNQGIRSVEVSDQIIVTNELPGTDVAVHGWRWVAGGAGESLIFIRNNNTENTFVLVDQFQLLADNPSRQTVEVYWEQTIQGVAASPPTVRHRHPPTAAAAADDFAVAMYATGTGSVPAGTQVSEFEVPAFGVGIQEVQQLDRSQGDEDPGPYYIIPPNMNLCFRFGLLPGVDGRLLWNGRLRTVPAD